MTSRPITPTADRSGFGRPRSFTDEEAFLATNRVLGVHGASELTLAAVAREIGCTGQALNARFGTRKDLLAAHSRWAAQRDLERFSRIRANGRSPLETIRLRFAIPTAEREEELAGEGAQLRWMSLLLEAQRDPDLRQWQHQRMNQFIDELAKLIGEAVVSGELDPTVDPMAIARLMVYATSGSSLYWFKDDRTTIEEEVVRVIDQILAPYLTSSQGDPRAIPAK